MFKESDPSLFFKSQKTHDRRLGEWAKTLLAADLDKIASQLNPQDRNCVIAGYADDEGVKNNSGRVGAHLAPRKIREYFYKMTPPFYFDLDCENPNRNSYKIFDVGDLDPGLGDLTTRHLRAQELALRAFSNNMYWIALGGGHDYAYPDISAFIEGCSKKSSERALIINFDAHLDVRPTDHGINSGTAFYRILKEYPHIDLVQVGIQSQCNSRTQFQWTEGRGAKVLTYDDLRRSGEDLTSFCRNRLGDLLAHQKCFISVDMDGFSNAYAPGCSQSFATGLQPDEFFKFVSFLCQDLDVRGLGLYECAPNLDFDNMTSKLAALIMHKFIFLG